MPAALLRNTLARGLWRAGCWLQLVARRLEVAGPATAPLEPAIEDAWEPSLPGVTRLDGPPPHWQRLLDGRDPRQLHAAPRPADGGRDPAHVPASHDAEPVPSGRDPEPVPAGRDPEPVPDPAATGEPPPERAPSEPAIDAVGWPHPAQPARPQPGPAARLFPPAQPYDDLPTHLPSAQPAPYGRTEPHPEHLVGRGATLHPHSSGHFMPQDRPQANQVAEGGRWPRLPDDTPLWTSEWPDPAGDRTARLDEEQRGTPWSG